MLGFAANGITSFSLKPIRIIAVFGLLISLASFLAGIWALYVRLFAGAVVPGWASIVIPIFILSGIQIMCLGVIGEYVGRIYLETKRRPRFFIEQRIGAGGWKSEVSERVPRWVMPNASSNA